MTPESTKTSGMAKEKLTSLCVNAIALALFCGNRIIKGVGGGGGRGMGQKSEPRPQWP